MSSVMRCTLRKPAKSIPRQSPCTALVLPACWKFEDLRGNTYRAVYTVRFAVRVFVLHVFQKKSKSGIATPKPDADLIRIRLKVAAKRAEELEDEQT